MDRQKTFAFNLSVTVLAFTLLLLYFVMAAPVQAQSLAQEVDNGTCISCHEDLYFLHDTGNWFCIRESPMACVSCHGGDPTATTQETAHYDRSAHPIVNEDISRCQECHVDEDECCECVSKFDQVAGVNEVKLDVPVTVVLRFRPNPKPASCRGAGTCQLAFGSRNPSSGCDRRLSPDNLYRT